MDLSRRPFRVRTLDGEYLARTLIVATGAHSRRLGVPGEDQYVGRGVSFCANCDGLFFRDKTIAVVGGGDSACDEAVFLAKFARQVWVVHRRDQFRANPRARERVLSHPKIRVIWNAVVEAIAGEKRVKSASIAPPGHGRGLRASGRWGVRLHRDGSEHPAFQGPTGPR